MKKPRHPWSVSGVYIISVTTDNDALRYVGSSVNVRKRLNEHLRMLRKGKHPRRLIQRAFDDYGEPKFNFEMLEACNELDLPEREKFWIEHLNPEFNRTTNTSRPSGWTPENDDLLTMHVPPWDPYESARERWREINSFSPVGLFTLSLKERF